VVAACLEVDPLELIRALREVFLSQPRLHRARAAQACLQEHLFSHWWCRCHDIVDFTALDSKASAQQVLLHTLAGDFAAVLAGEVDVYHWEYNSIDWAARGLAMLGAAAGPAVPALFQQVTRACEEPAKESPKAEEPAKESPKAESQQVPGPGELGADQRVHVNLVPGFGELADFGELAELTEQRLQREFEEHSRKEREWNEAVLATQSAQALGKLGKHAASAVPRLLQAQKGPGASTELQDTIATAVAMIRADQGDVDLAAMAAAFERGHDLGTALVRFVPTASLWRVLHKSCLDDEDPGPNFDIDAQRFQAALLLLERGEHKEPALDEMCRCAWRGSNEQVVDDALVRQLSDPGSQRATAEALRMSLSNEFQGRYCWDRRFPRRCLGERFNFAPTIPWALVAIDPDAGDVETTRLLREALRCETHPALQSAAAGAILALAASGRAGGEDSRQLGESRDEAMQRLVDQLSDPSPSIRYEAASVLEQAAGQLKPGEQCIEAEAVQGRLLLEALSKATEDASGHVRTNAARAMSKLSARV